MDHGADIQDLRPIWALLGAEMKDWIVNAFTTGHCQMTFIQDLTIIAMLIVVSIFVLAIIGIWQWFNK